MIETRVTKLLGIKYPIIQGALGGCSEDPRFVAAVCNAGCLGILAAVHMGPGGLRHVIHKVKELTDKPFGVNLLPVNPQYERLLEVCMEELVPIFSHGRYNPVKSIAAASQLKVISLPTIGSVKHAVRAEKDGADAVIAQGWEGGGHTGYVGTIVLVPAVVKKVKIPVIAAGGIATPEQAAATFCLGAEGIEMGTRFMLTEEARIIHPNAKKKMLEATEEDTYATIHVSGRQQRLLVNDVLRERFMGRPEVKAEDHYWTMPPWGMKAAFEGKVEEGLIFVGQGVGLIDKILPIKDLVEWMMEGMERILKEKANLIA